MTDKLRQLHELNNILDSIRHLPDSVRQREVFDHSDEHQWQICGYRFPKNEFVILKNEDLNKYIAYYSMDRDAALRANRINYAIVSGYTATVNREYDNTATVLLENYETNEGMQLNFTRLLIRDYQACPEACFDETELERMCMRDMYGYGTTTGYTYTYHSPAVSIRNNINGHVAQVSNSAEIQIGTDGVKLVDSGHNWHQIATAADMLSIFGNPFVNEILNYANTPSDDPIERLVRGRILEIFNNATHLGGER